MKHFSAVFALTALAAATLGMAQQTPPPAGPPAGTSQQQSPDTAPADPSASTNSQSGQTDRQALMKECMTQVTNANPGVPQKDIQNFCDKEVTQASQPQPQN